MFGNFDEKSLKNNRGYNFRVERLYTSTKKNAAKGQKIFKKRRKGRRIGAKYKSNTKSMECR